MEYKERKKKREKILKKIFEELRINPFKTLIYMLFAWWFS